MNSNLIKILKRNDFVFYILKNIQRYLKLIINKIINFSGINQRISNLENSLIHDLYENEFDWKNYCLNGQKFRKKIVTEIFEKISFKYVIETGTEYGFTTKYFSQFCENVLSIEKSKPIFKIAKKNLKNEKNVKLILNDSKNLKSILETENSDKKIENIDQIFFYLDAHSEDDYPLLDEISYIVNNYKNYILLIDDFEVPNDENYGYDSYRGKKLNIKFIRNLLTKNEVIFFPKIPSHKETGRLRGYTIISKNETFNNTLENIEELSKFHLAN